MTGTAGNALTLALSQRERDSVRRGLPKNGWLTRAARTG
jgi:hypothetical protein